ncbi:MAG: hypothetical protein DMD73_14170 [Gemmatimonadetes bacterium]|nr:MAG: hypothetical protein DMD73_14170 [Gemmatimonadota bacterium]
MCQHVGDLAAEDLHARPVDRIWRESDRPSPLGAERIDRCRGARRDRRGRRVGDARAASGRHRGPRGAPGRDRYARSGGASGEVVESSNRGFDAAALAYVRGALFRPGRVRGLAVRVLIRLPIAFTLQGAR